MQRERTYTITYSTSTITTALINGIIVDEDNNIMISYSSDPLTYLLVWDLKLGTYKSITDSGVT
jgi:hypothetical protein